MRSTKIALSVASVSPWFFLSTDLFSMKKWVIAIVGLCVSAIAIALVLSKTELRETAALIAGVGYRVPVVLASMYLATFPIRALRWQCMLPIGTLTFVEALKGVLIGFAGNNVLPTR